ncbi:MAG: magnesium transporter [Candidatus Bathyarchaeota archaeon]|nr:magnesium transporter [Candidatus Bathyarchaeota archaeon]
MSYEGVSKNFFRLLKETSVAYFFGLGGLFAGFIIASYLGLFKLAPWTIALYPALVSAKGVTGGLLSGRLSTALHLGTIRPSFFKNTPSFYMLIEALIVLTLATSATISLISIVFGQLFWGLTIVDFSGILLVVIATMSMGLLLSIITINIAFISFKKGSDPDIVVYPIMSTISDVFITVCYVLVLTLYFFGDLGKLALLILSLAVLSTAIYVFIKNFHESDFIKTIKESLFTMILVALMVNITGTVLIGISNFVENRKEIYIIYPALIGMIGNVGSVIGSTATTKLALGLLQPSFSSMKRHIKSIFSAWGASLLMFIILAFLALLLTTPFSFSSLYNIISILFLTNVFAVLAIVLLTYSISILTFKKGLDPDNFVIPVESSFADVVTSIALLASLLMLGLT